MINVGRENVVGYWNNKKKNSTTQACAAGDALVGDHESGEYNSDVRNIDCS